MQQTPQDLLIFPCNGSGAEALDALGSGFNLLGFVDDTLEKQAASFHGQPVYPRAAFERWPSALVLAIPGSPTSYLTRRSVIERLGLSATRWATVVHPSAQVSARACVGRNVLIMAGVVITSNAVIGDHVCVLPNSVIHHDARVGSWSLIGSNVTIAGAVRVGENCYIGSGASLKNGITVGAHSMVGLGSTVLTDVGLGDVVAGNPAKLLAARKRQTP